MREFYALYAEHLTGICSRYIVDDDSTKDVLQNTLIKILTKIAEFECRECGSLQAWAAKIAVNESLKFLKAKKRDELFLLGGHQEYVEDPDSDDPPIENIAPEEIFNMVSQLPTSCRTVFNLYVFEEKTHREIAHLLGIKVGTSTSQLSRAKSLLAKMIETYNIRQQPL